MSSAMSSEMSPSGPGTRTPESREPIMLVRESGISRRWVPSELVMRRESPRSAVTRPSTVPTTPVSKVRRLLRRKLARLLPLNISRSVASIAVMLMLSVLTTLAPSLSPVQS